MGYSHPAPATIIVCGLCGFNGTEFVGFAQNLSSKGANKDGEFTGLMTEEPSRYALNYNGRQVYTIANESEIPSYGLMVLQEGGLGKKLFSNRTGLIYFNSSDERYYLNFNGLSESSNASEFNTGLLR